MSTFRELTNVTLTVQEKHEQVLHMDYSLLGAQQGKTYQMTLSKSQAIFLAH